MSLVAIFGCDPGGHTGLAWGVFETKQDIGAALRGRTHSGSATIVGGERLQIREITSLWQAFYRQAVNDAGVSPAKVWLAMEDFILKPGESAGGKDSTSPLPLIWGVEGYRMGQADQWNASRRGQRRQVVIPPMVLQLAGQAKGFATKARLKEWDLWTVGREHERSAWAHVAFLLKRIQTQGLG